MAGLTFSFSKIIFQEIEQATKAMSELQDTTLPSSDRGGMHLEYCSLTLHLALLEPYSKF